MLAIVIMGCAMTGCSKLEGGQEEENSTLVVMKGGTIKVWTFEYKGQEYLLSSNGAMLKVD